MNRNMFTSLEQEFEFWTAEAARALLVCRQIIAAMPWLGWEDL